jgi:hypothetical protein
MVTDAELGISANILPVLANQIRLHHRFATSFKFSFPLPSKWKTYVETGITCGHWQAGCPFKPTRSISLAVYSLHDDIVDGSNTNGARNSFQTCFPIPMIHSKAFFHESRTVKLKPTLIFTVLVFTVLMCRSRLDFFELLVLDSQSSRSKSI